MDLFKYKNSKRAKLHDPQELLHLD